MGDTSGSVTLQAPAIAGSTVVNLPASSMNMGNGGGSVSTNTAFGNSALNANTTGVQNTAVGYLALTTNSTGNFNNAFGGGDNTVASGSLNSNTTGSGNNAFGAGALGKNTTGSSNSAFGHSALVNNTTGTPNSAFGYQALYSNTTGTNNVGIGASSLYSNTTATWNVAVGSESLYKNTGVRNTGIGHQTGYQITTGAYNTAVGSGAMGETTVSTTGNDNCAFGSWHDGVVEGPLAAVTSGFANIAMGNGAIRSLTTGSNNVAIGYRAGALSPSLTTGTDNVMIGSNACTSSAGGVNQIVIGSGIAGQGDNYFTFGKASNIVYNQFTVNATWTRTSDQRLKKNIEDSELGLEFINKLRTVKYNWRPSIEVPEELENYHAEENRMDTETTMHGFIAQEVKQALDEVGVDNFAGWHQQDDGVQGISYEMFVMPLVKAVKELKAELDTVKAELQTIKGAA